MTTEETVQMSDDAESHQPVLRIQLYAQNRLVRLGVIAHLDGFFSCHLYCLKTGSPALVCEGSRYETPLQ